MIFLQFWFLVLICGFSCFAWQSKNPNPPSKPFLGDLNDGSRAQPVHSIALRDPDGEVIRATDQVLVPFSTLQTCGADCHDVATISRGWHFTTSLPGAEGGRRGQPWILTDPATATQLPLSYHDWPGCYRPESVGITPWKFALLFGGWMPGGISGQFETDPGLRTRWMVSGNLEVNCLACHDNSPAYSQAEYGRQIALESFRWAAAAASGIAVVAGSTKEMPNSFDYLLPNVEDSLMIRKPSVVYAPERFFPGAKVVFDIVREVPARRCYFCHSNADFEGLGKDRWNGDEDIHLARGMTCVDCHRNGLDHSMIRGYEEEAGVNNSGAAVSLSCRGCHLANEQERNFARGRLGAPYPKHTGLPPVHFTRLTCTACHSGPRPETNARRLNTSQAHRLGGLTGGKSRESLPHLYYPVFAAGADGKIAPNRLLWPAFWGRLVKGEVRPVSPEQIKKLISKAKIQLNPPTDSGWPRLDDALLTGILKLLQDESPSDSTPVYIAGGKLHRMGAFRTPVIEDHPSAEPYLWPFAHDVRRASLSLGARGCGDCHEPDAPIFFGKIHVDSPLGGVRADVWKMHSFQENLNIAYVADFARSFQYRPWLKGGAISSAVLLLVFALAYFMRGIEQLSAATSGEKLKRICVNLFGLVAGLACTVSGLSALISGKKLTGYWLLIHAATAPVFAVSIVLVMLFWAHRNRLLEADWSRIRRPFASSVSEESSARVVVLRKLFFWIAAAAAIPAVLSITFTVFPVMASVNQETFVLLHRYSVVPLAVSGFLFACFTLAGWIAKSAE
jgi:hypothetical protein